MINRKNGFTLVEIMITLAILGMLVAQAGYAYFTYIAEAKATQTTNDLSTLVKRFTIYKNKKGSYPPAGDLSGDQYKDIPQNIWNSTPYGFVGGYSWDGQRIILSVDSSIKESDIIIGFIDGSIDDNNPSTGKITIANGNLYLRLG